MILRHSPYSMSEDPSNPGRFAITIQYAIAVDNHENLAFFYMVDDGTDLTLTPLVRTVHNTAYEHVSGSSFFTSSQIIFSAGVPIAGYAATHDLQRGLLLVGISTTTFKLNFAVTQHPAGFTNT